MERYTFYKSVTGTNYTDSNPLNGYNYYVITAINSTGESAYSTPTYCNFTSGGNVPTAPTNVSASQSGTSVYVSWTGVAGATSYNVYRSSSANGSYTYLNSVTGSNYTDNSPVNGYNYYEITAVNSTGESSFSSPAYCNFSLGVSVPTAPTNVSATQNGTSVYISWTGVTGATSYNVEWSSDNSNWQYVVQNTSSTNTSHPNPVSGTNYYRIQAVNSSGGSNWSNVTTCNYTPPIAKPAAPTNVSAVQNGSSIIVSWSSVPGATSYGVYRSNSSNGTYTGYSPTLYTTSFTDNAPLNGYNYYGVVAVNSAGESNKSYISCNYTAPPAAPKLPNTFFVECISSLKVVRADLLYNATDKATVDKFKYTLYEDGKAVFEYTNAPNNQSDSFGTYGNTSLSGNIYGIYLGDPLLYMGGGTHKIKVQITSGTQSIFTAEQSVTIF